MPNTKLIALRELREELVSKRSDAVHRLDKASKILKEEARTNLEQAQDKERIAIQADEDVGDKL